MDLFSITDAADALIRCLLDNEDNDPQPSPTPNYKRSTRLMEKAAPAKAQDFSQSKVSGPVIILAFDEAHVLIDQEWKDLPLMWSALSELRRSLRFLNEHPLFSVFLSTTGKIAQITPTKQNGSLAPSLIPIIPFSDLGFDHLAQKIAVDGSCSLEDVASDAHMVTLGRPL